MVLDHPRPAEDSPLQMRDIPQPNPAVGEIRVQIRCCGLCHTDLHTVEGDLSLPKLPIVPGHQIVGVVEAVGPGVQRFREGDRVGIPWLYSTDQTCRFCKRELENLCEHAQFTGLNVNGGYAEAVVVGEDYAYALPDVFSDENAAPLLCAGVIGYRSYRLAEARKGETLGLYGFCASAHLVLQLARYSGNEVFVFTRSPRHQEMAQNLNADWVGSADDTPPHLLDAAIIFAPSGELVQKALKMLDKAGRLVLAGITMTTIPELDYACLYQERIIRSVANSTRRDVREFLELAAEVPIKTEVECYPLASANDALVALKHSRLRAAGVLKV